MKLVKSKDQKIETLRGVAIFLMVAGHVIGTNSTSGMNLPDDHALRYFYESLVFLRMPLFTVISGFVYEYRPLQNETRSKFLPGKFKRLLLPLVTVSTLTFLMQAVVPGTNIKTDFSQIWKIYVITYMQFWYLHSLTLVFITIYFVEKYQLLSTPKKWLICLSVALFLNFTLVPIQEYYFTPNVFGFRKYPYLLSFFLLGLGLNRFRELFKAPKVLTAVVVLFAAGIFLHQLDIFKVIDVRTSAVGFLGMFVGIFGTIAVIHFSGKSSFLAGLGHFSYSIYLFHVFGTAGSRIVLKMMGISHEGLIFIFGVLFGIVFPIIVEIVIDPIPVLRKSLIGKNRSSGYIITRLTRKPAT